jgi:hypothetical protein
MAGMKTATIVSGGGFPAFQLWEVLRVGGTLPAGITVSRQFQNLESGCAQLTVQSDPDNGATIFHMGMDSAVSPTDAGLQLNAGASYTWNAVDKNAVSLLRWFKSTAAGSLLVTIEEY